MSEAQIEAELYTATFADEQRRREIIHDLAARADEALGALRSILKTNAKTLWSVAVHVIREIGYPQNTAAIPEVVDQVSDRNSPAWQEAVQTLAEMEKQAVIPYVIQVIWDRRIHIGPQQWRMSVRLSALWIENMPSPVGRLLHIFSVKTLLLANWMSAFYWMSLKKPATNVQHMPYQP